MCHIMYICRYYMCYRIWNMLYIIYNINKVNIIYNDLKK